MSEKGSVFQKGGGGTNFEQAIQTAFLTTLIIRGNAPCLPANEIIEVSFQNTRKGFETDDLLVVAKSALGDHKLLVQIKHDISFTLGNETFKEVLQVFWKDFNNATVFDRTKDKLIVVKNGMTKDERNHLKSLFNWANTHATETDFLDEVNRIKGKKERLEVFRQCLKEANNGIALADRKLWEFLKCVDVLEYDFLNQGSVDESYFLNLLKLSKRKETSLTEKEIWNSLLAFTSKLNKEGGNVTTESIQSEELYKYFAAEQLSPYLKAVEKLKSDSEIILKPLKSTIGDLHLDRSIIKDAIVDTVASFQFTIVTGKPGAGKSAETKDVLSEEFPHASKFVFRADQFNRPHLANVFSDLGIDETIKDIVSTISFTPDKVIFIDSLEKLLEADPECAFKQLFALLKEFPDIKVIASSRKHAIDLIIQKFNLKKEDLGIVEVLPLNDEEVSKVLKQYPQLQGLIKNPAIKALLQSPKYLDFAVSALRKSSDDYSNISLSEFKNKLWDSLVVDVGNTNGGLPIKRENAFMEIAVKRAKEMKLFTQTKNADAEAVLLLEKDEIIFQEVNKRRYAPSHDILEDWALVRFVSSQYEDYPTAKDFFEHLGNEPAIRRAFRLWVEDYLLEDSPKVLELIKKSLADTSIEKYWADELLIAVFKSEDCSSFFASFERELLEANADFLNRCIHLIRTACRETKTDNSTILLPIGSGWQEALFFIRKHLGGLNNLRLPIYNLLYDWEFRLLFQIVTEEEAKAVKDIVLYFINQIEQVDEFWEERNIESRKKGLITLLFNLAEVAKEEIEDLVKRASIKKDERENWRIRKFYETIIGGCLSGLHTYRLVKKSPELVIETAWKEWKLKPPEEPVEGSITSLLGSRSLMHEECWGIEDEFSFSPAGIYKTPIYNLLKHHPLLGLQFICEFLNYAVDFYVQEKDCDYKRQITQVQLRLNDGTIVTQWGNLELWTAYRGLSVTHYLLESLLMSLEKYLLETAQLKTEVSKSNTKFMFDYLFHKSNNVAITGVLASVAMAEPEVAEEQIAPLFSVREFYRWDIDRTLQESSAFATADYEISFAQEERFKSNKLPHRKKFFRGLADFIVDYQFKIRIANPQIHALFDVLQKSANEEDIFWKKTLNEIDIRTWDVKNDEENNRIILQPKYEQKVEEFLQSGKQQMEAQSITMKWSGLLWNAYEKQEDISFETWQEAFNYYNNTTTSDPLFDRPISLSVLGLRDFSNELSDQQKKWCIANIKKVISIILYDTMSRHYHLNMSYNLMEKDVALQSFHLLAANIENDTEPKEMLQLMLYTLIAPFSDHEVTKNIEYIRTTFFSRFPSEAKQLWISLIKYAHFRKAYPFYYDDHDEERLKAARDHENTFIQNSLNSENTDLDVEAIDLTEYESYLLFRAFLIISPNSTDEIFLSFIKKVVSIIVDELQLEEDRSYNRRNKKRKIDRRDVIGSEPFLADILLNADVGFSKQLINLLLHPILNNTKLTRINAKELYEFIDGVFEFLVLKVSDSENQNPLPLNYLVQLKKFWEIWEYLYGVLKASNEKPFMSTLLFNVRFLLFDYHGKPNEREWKALQDKKEFYYLMIKEVGENHLVTIMNVFSIIGEKVFLPKGLTWVVELLKKNPRQKLTLINVSGERFVKKLFYSHISAIKSNKALINDFVWLLNEMVDLGSSTAYLFRENVITYKGDN